MPITATPAANTATLDPGPAERCDRCSARALTSTLLASGRTLAFCGHHYRQYHPALATRGAIAYHLTDPPEPRLHPTPEPGTPPPHP